MLFATAENPDITPTEIFPWRIIWMLGFNLHLKKRWNCFMLSQNVELLRIASSGFNLVPCVLAGRLVTYCSSFQPDLFCDSLCWSEVLVHVFESQGTHCNTVLTISLRDRQKTVFLHLYVHICEWPTLWMFKEGREQITLFMIQQPLKVSFNKIIIELCRLFFFGIESSSVLTKTFYLAWK